MTRRCFCLPALPNLGQAHSSLLAQREADACGPASSWRRSQFSISPTASARVRFSAHTRHLLYRCLGEGRTHAPLHADLLLKRACLLPVAFATRTWVLDGDKTLVDCAISLHAVNLSRLTYLTLLAFLATVALRARRCTRNNARAYRTCTAHTLQLHYICARARGIAAPCARALASRAGTTRATYLYYRLTFTTFAYKCNLSADSPSRVHIVCMGTMVTCRHGDLLGRGHGDMTRSCSSPPHTGSGTGAVKTAGCRRRAVLPVSNYY